MPSTLWSMSLKSHKNVILNLSATECKEYCGNTCGKYLGVAVDRHALSTFVVVLESTVNGDLYVRERRTAYYSQMFRQKCCKKAGSNETQLQACGPFHVFSV